jgi:M6 family metalloprotease-like protein
MPILRSALLIALTLVCGPQADAARLAEPVPERNRDAAGRDASPPMIGRLEMVWGDPGPAAKAAGDQSVGDTATEFRVALVDDTGGRHPLDPDQALRAAEDLYALFGKRVAVSMVPSVAKRGGAGERIIDAIVPVADLSPSKAAGVPSKIAGVTAWVTLMCKFSDIATEQRNLNYFQQMYQTGAGRLGNYWDEVSYGKISLAGSSAHGWLTLPEPRSYYVPVDPATNKEDADLTKLFQDCTALHNATVNFAANGGAQGLNMVFNGNLDGAAWGGSRCATLDGLNKCWSTTWNPPFAYENIATFAHEMGHGYGLPHANNSDQDSDPYDSPWDVMSDSRRTNSSRDAVYGLLPKHLSVYSRERLGWIDAARKTTIVAGTGARSIPLDRASLRGSANRQVIVLSYPGTTSRYYTVEVRKRSGGIFEANLPGDAVIVHEVQTSRSEPAWSQDADVPPANRANNEGSMFKVGETWVSPDYAFRVTVEAATAEGFVVTVRPAPRAVRAPGAGTVPAVEPRPQPATRRRAPLRGGQTRR